MTDTRGPDEPVEPTPDPPPGEEPDGDRELSEQELGEVSGGRAPRPGGPIPIPYPSANE